jgi:hypothetical protein
MKEAFLTAFLALLLGSGLAWAAPSDPPPPPPPSNPNADNPGNPNRPPDRDRDRDHHPRFSPSGDRQPSFFPREGEHGDSFRHLPEEDRQKVRNAFEKAWKNPAVIQARNDLMKANEQYRQALQQAIKEADPEVTKILDRVKSEGPQGGHLRMGLGPMPDTSDPEFVHKALQRLPFELQVLFQGPGPGDRGPGDRGERGPGGPGDRGPGDRGPGDRGPGERGDRPERHELSPQTMRLHDKLMQMPEVAEAVKQLEESESGHRMEAWKHLRDIYQTAARTEMAKLRDGARPAEQGAPPPDAVQPK